MNNHVVRAPRIAITGTKGKTTVTSVLAAVLQNYQKTVLKVDTKGHYVNGNQKSTLKDSTRVYGLVPTVCPGRFLYELDGHEKDGVAVLECSLGSSRLAGLGYGAHNIGIFLNVMEDHLGSSDRLKTKEDIMLAKSFIFRMLHLDPYAVFNADDKLVVKALKFIPEDLNDTKVPFGLEFTFFDVVEHLKNGGSAVTVEDEWVVIKKDNRIQKIVKLNDIGWTFQGQFKPSIYNLLAVVAGAYSFFKGELPQDFSKRLAAVKLDPTDGRLTLFKNQQGIKILADYAHEKYSLREVAKLAKSLTSNKGQVIGVVRLAYDRTDKMIIDTGKFIAKDYDQFVVYDKIDGYWRQPRDRLRSRKFSSETVGRVSTLLSDAIKELNSNCEQILREDLAIERAVKIAKPGDVVVVIVNDDIKRSIEFIKDSFKAELA
jgi:cyanophycin synthetase